MRLALAALVVLAAVLYLPGLTGPVLLDDRYNLAPLAAVGDGTLSARDYLAGAGQAASARPVARASFLASWWLTGDDIRGFKAGNLVLHLLCGLAVFALARRLLTVCGGDGAAGAALFVCAAWLLAPLLVSTVLYAVQRMAQLAALFCLAGLWCYAHARLSGARWPLATAAACWIAGTLSKENAAVLPLLALLLELFLFRECRHARAFRLVLAGLVAAAAAALLARIALDPQWLLAGYGGRDFGLGERLLTQPRALLDYLGNLLLLPGSSPMGLFRDDVTASRGLLDPPTTLAAMAVLAALVLAALVLAALRSYRGPLAAAGLGLLFFLAAHGVESGIFPLELYFEHRNYLPAFGVFFAAAAAARVLAPRTRRLVRVVAVAWLLMAAAHTAHRAWIWGSEPALYLHATATHPRSARAWLGLASVHFNAGEHDPGLAALDRAATLLGDESRLALALQALAAYCLAQRPVPETVYRRFESASVVGVDLHTVNALEWSTGGIATCDGLDRPRLARAIADLEPLPAHWSQSRQSLRDARLSALLRALRKNGP